MSLLTGFLIFIVSLTAMVIVFLTKQFQEENKIYLNNNQIKNTSSISNDLSTNWITQGKNQQGQATLNACQAKYKCCGFKDDTDHAIQPCLRFSPGERLPGCGPTLIKHEQSDLLKIGLLLLLSSLIYIYGMWIAFKMIKKRVWSQEAKMPQLTHGIPDTIYEDGDNL